MIESLFAGNNCNIKTKGSVCMKKAVVIAVVVLVAVLAFCVPSTPTNTEFLRIHIRADSNNSDDQSVKYMVKAAVVDYLTPYLTQATTKEKAMQVVKKHLDGIKSVCDKVLAKKGKKYRATVKLCAEQFPDRSYNGFTLPSGVYDALIIELGSGSGNNWWCVVYPPLCFVGGEGNGSGNIVYKSRLLEIIREWMK